MSRGDFAGLPLKVSVYDMLSLDVACAANNVTLAHADRSYSPPQKSRVSSSLVFEAHRRRGRPRISAQRSSTRSSKFGRRLCGGESGIVSPVLRPRPTAVINPRRSPGKPLVSCLEASLADTPQPPESSVSSINSSCMTKAA